MQIELNRFMTNNMYRILIIDIIINIYHSVVPDNIRSLQGPSYNKNQSAEHALARRRVRVGGDSS